MLLVDFDLHWELSWVVRETLLFQRFPTLSTFRKDKDIFLDIYKSALSRRLLNKLSVSNDAEDCFITKLKVECGQQAIQKLASMFTDMALSDQLQEEYMRASHHGSPGGVTHEVRVLQTNAWPEKADDAPVVPCPEMLGFSVFCSGSPGSPGSPGVCCF